MWGDGDGQVDEAMLLMAASPQPIYFLMDHRISKVPVLGSLFRLPMTSPLHHAQKTPQRTMQSSPCWLAVTCWPASPKDGAPKAVSQKS
jgi:1-acyl-sn-glycerol-3-phosphate acyltransferase